MKRHKFDEIIKRYLSNDSQAGEEKMLDEWADMHFSQYAKHSVFDSKEDEVSTGKLIWGKIQVDSGLKKGGWGSRRTIQWVIGVAASFIAVLVCNYFILSSGDGISSESYPRGTETKNITEVPQRVSLSDGSVALLEAGASLVIDESYGSKARRVFLKGEAFFKVQPDSQRPFFVHTGDLVTKVLGTSFRISSRLKEKTIEVSVITGKVSVYTGTEGESNRRNGVIATPNQKVIYNTELKTLRHDLTDIPRIIPLEGQQPDFNFKGAHLLDVVRFMQRIYEIEIIVENPLLNQCIFTGDLNGLDLYRQLDIICEVMGTRYEIRGVTVFINGENCSKD